MRECPDFAERGVCGTKGCKLPHVIRASRGKMAQAAEQADAERAKAEIVAAAPVEAEQREGQPQKLGDEFVSLMFEESEEESEEGEEAEEEEEENDEEAVDEDVQSDDDEQDVDTLLSEGDHEM